MFQVNLNSGHKIITRMPTLTVLSQSEGLGSCAIQDTRHTLILPPVCHTPDASFKKAGRTLTAEEGKRAAETHFRNIHLKHYENLHRAPNEFKHAFVMERLKRSNLFIDHIRTTLYDSTSYQNMELIRSMFNSQGIPTWVISHKRYHRLVAKTVACINFAYQNSINIRTFERFTKKARFWLNGYQSSDTVSDKDILQFIQISPVWYKILSVTECSEVPQVNGIISYNKKELECLKDGKICQQEPEIG
jgi:hypothetical protein